MSALISDDAAKFLSLPRLPGRLTLIQAAVLLGVGEHDVATIVRAGLLKPLGKPEQKAPKFFAAADVATMAGDPVVMDRIVKAITKGWQRKNERQRNNLRPGAAQRGENDQNSSLAAERPRPLPV
jgi:hypothetical protein